VLRASVTITCYFSDNPMFGRFPPVPGTTPYEYPSPEELFGQSIACVTVLSEALDRCVAPALSIEDVNKYSSHFLPGMDARFPNLASLMQEERSRGPFPPAEDGASTITCLFSTTSGAIYGSTSVVTTAIRVFAKSKSWGGSLFQQFVQPFYGTGMLHQSWRRGSGGRQHSQLLGIIGHGRMRSARHIITRGR
jgi:hypothetical protein